MKKSTRRERSAAHRAKHDKEPPRERPETRARRTRSGNAPLVRNLVIIAGLIVAIAFTSKKYQRTLAEREQARQTADASRAPAQAVPAEPPAEEIVIADPTPDPETVPLPEAEPLPEPPPEPAPLTPAQSLIRLRAELAAGKRDPMPLGTLRRGDSDFFLVTTPMTWAQANGFADAYGGHLPLASRSDDLGWLASQLAAAATSTDPARSSLWIGGLTHADQWHSTDGSPMASAPAGEGGFAAIRADGTLHARGDADRHPFYIQWQRDGSNPASLRAVLARTKASLDGPAPSYPPGTVSDGERRLLIVARSTNATDARELASTAGGHLMVPATPAEADWIDRETAAAKYPQGVWLGATLNDAEWKWDTGEAWAFARWDPAAVLGEGSALLLAPGAGWRAADPATEASGFIIEWSRDSATPAPPPAGESHDDILAKSRELLAAADKQRAAELAENARNFVWTLDIWLRTNNKGDLARWKPRVEALKARLNANRVPGKLPEAPDSEFSDRMLKIARGCLEKQRTLDAAFVIKAGRIRDAYTARLLELAAAEEQRGQPLLARKLTATADAAGDLEAWLGLVGDFAM
ncbi:MAG: hypothetical protein B9S38_05530 [Verrucomicrobiia bacterium Tous-C4TDCM]|jgi:hypothetical protein|nr:MAG: hypothetical protein B9S38_05530 [Verrucomicrobiae bacterium Tous-C4TDCM]